MKLSGLYGFIIFLIFLIFFNNSKIEKIDVSKL